MSEHKHLYKVGDYVVPISKSYGKDFATEPHWKKAKDSDTPYLIVVEDGFYNGDVEGYFCTSPDKSRGGNFYTESDLIPYAMDTEQAFTLLVQGKITQKAYERITNHG